MSIGNGSAGGNREEGAGEMGVKASTAYPCPDTKISTFAYKGLRHLN